MVTDIINMAMNAGKEGRVVVTGVISSRSVTELTEDILTLKNAGVKKVTFQVNSPGGSVTDGLAMFDLITALGNDVETVAYVNGMCASAATYVALACDRVIMAKNATFMVHEPEGGTWGTVKDWKADLEFFEELRNKVVNIYCAASGLKAADVEQLMLSTSFMNSKKARDLGFVDEIEGESHASTEEDAGSGAEPAEPEEAPAPENTAPVENEMPVLQVVDKPTLLKTLKNKAISLIRKPVEEVPAVDNSALEAANAKVQELQNALEASKQEVAARDASIEALKTEMEAQNSALNERVQREVAAKLATMCEPANNLPAPKRQGKVDEKQLKENARKLYETKGLAAAEEYLLTQINQ